MAVLDWTDGFKVGVAFMDADHHEAVEAINALESAAGTELARRFAAYIAHCRDHFAREEDLMRRTGFFALAPHSGEHERVLAWMRATLTELEAGRGPDGARLARELADWLVAHRNSMDLVTAQVAGG